MLLWVALCSSICFGSKPVPEKSRIACETLLKMAEQERLSPFSSSTLIPVNRLLGSDRCPFIPVMWREGDLYSREFPSPGLVYMFSTSETASNEIVSRMAIKAVTPKNDMRDPIGAAAATIALMLSPNPPRYIRDAVLIRDGVIMVVPLLKRTALKSAATGKPLYIPLITKGHQELEKDDVLSAVFAAWALEPWLDQIPAKASLYLRPMAESRTQGQRALDEERSIFTISTQEYLPQIKIIYENFMQTATDQDLRHAMTPRRCTECTTCPWAQNCRARMKESNDLSMMPLPPRRQESEILKQLGFQDMNALAELDINSERFIQTALITGISPETLRYYVSHSLASKLDNVLVTEPFKDPFAGVKRIVHVDFEDVLDHKIRSGVYLFGTEIQDTKPLKKQKFLKEAFIQAQELNQDSVDEAWSEFLRFLKTDREIAPHKYLVTTYSKHENVKIEQEFDIVKQDASEFSPQQKRSPYYSEVEKGDRKIGRLIRNKSFFSRYKDVTPADVFNVLDKTVDLLDYVRNNLAFPTYSNGIKKISPYVATADETIAYDEISGGLDSIKVALDRYQTGETSFMDRLISYNSKDINLNRLVSDFIRRFAGQPVYAQIQWKDDFLQKKEFVEEAVSTRRWASSIEDKSRLLASIMGKEISDLNDDQREELKSLLDRTQYLTELKNDSLDSELTESERRAIQQVRKFELDSKRQASLHSFFHKVNRRLNDDPTKPSTRALARLFSQPASFLTPHHIDLILLFHEMKAAQDGTTLLMRRSLLERISLPRKLSLRWSELLGKNSINLDSTTPKEAERLWHGVYLLKAFSL